MSGRRLAQAAAAVAVVVSVAVAVARLTDGDGGAGGSGADGGAGAGGAGAAPSAAAAEEFLDAYQRSRTVTFAAEQTFTRTLADGRELRSARRLVQRPPERLLVGGGSAEGRVGGRLVRCTTRPGAEPGCVDAGAAPPYDEEVAAELADLRRLVGEQGAYRVAVDGDGCFALSLVAAFPSPTYGEGARFCFDPATGAPTTVEVRHREGTDRTETTAVDLEVTDADLVVGSDLGSAEPGP